MRTELTTIIGSWLAIVFTYVVTMQMIYQWTSETWDKILTIVFLFLFNGGVLYIAYKVITYLPAGA